ncbi:WD repeat and HMG-box DNA binding protein 1 [Ciona intestinalis]
MSNSKPSFRYGHSEGRTEVCYDHSGKHLVSCGFDGNVKIWKSIKDDNPTNIKAGERVYSVGIKGKTLFSASDENSVDKFSFPDGSPDGCLVRFTGTVTHLSVSETRKLVAAGSSDFDIKTIDVETGKQKSYLGHQAPILSVAVDPMDEYLASSSCDGNLKIWTLKDAKCVKTLQIIGRSNDVGNSQTLSKISWRPVTGEDIAVPTETGVKIFNRVTWVLLQTLTSDVTSTAYQCCSFSQCGRFLASASADGWIVVWDTETQLTVRKIQHPLKSCISSIAWNPQQNNCVAFSDTRGQIGVLEDVVESEEPTKPRRDEDDLDALFDEEDDNMMVDMMADEDDKPQTKSDVSGLPKRSKPNIFDDDDDQDDDNNKNATQESDLPPIPCTLDVFTTDTDVDLAPPTILPSLPIETKYTLDDDASSVATATVTAPTNFQPSSMQPPFQPTSTPTHLSHRFMVWNAVGVIRSYTDVTESAIDVEFHDTQTHHALHLPNHDQYTMADLSVQAVVLAAESSVDAASKLKCVHFSSWDNNKEWVIEMPDGEEIQAVTTGDGWIAVCTDALQVRFFTLGGIQRQILSIPGNVVAMAASMDQLLVAYHITQGFGKNQCLGFMLLEVGVSSGSKPRSIVGGSPLPISQASKLEWVGFTAEGTPATVDTLGVVRMMNRSFCQTWTTVVKLKSITKSRHDHCWVVGLHENPQQIRYIQCKGSIYPSTLPRPTMAVAHYKIPLCEPESDKGKYEEEYWRTKIFSSHREYLTSRGYETDGGEKQKSDLVVQQTLMRLFALCCKSDAEYQAFDVCSMMPSSASMSLAIKYSSRIRKIMLAQRLSEVCQEKVQEEQEAILKQQRKVMQIMESDDEEEEEDFRTELQSGYSAAETEWSSQKSTRKPTSSRPADVDNDDDDVTVTSQSTEPRKEMETNKEVKVKPVRSLSSQLAGSRKNPFKKSVSSVTSSTKPSTSAASPSGSVLDGIKRATPVHQSKKQTEGAKGSKSKEKKSGQSTLFSTKLNLTSTPKPKKTSQRSKLDANEEDEVQVLQEKPTAADNEEVPRIPTTRVISGVQLFLEEHLQSIEEQHPDLDGIEVRKIGIKQFRALPAEEKQTWNSRAKSNKATASKRKHEVDENDPPNSDDVILSTNPAKNLRLDLDESTDAESGDARAKLSAFAYSSAE